MSPAVVIVATVGIIVLSAFFVAVEFALIAARRHRLEEAAVSSRAARAAVRNSAELTVVLAGSQLGITACTLALGAITKPAFHHWLTPILHDLGLAGWIGDVASFVVALLVITFLHLVIGEMAPKSWAIAHPERSSIILAVPMRAFMWVFRPVLAWLNHSANWCVRKVGVVPADEAATGQDPAALRHLVEHSANVGALDAAYSRWLSDAIDMESTTMGDLLRPGRPPAALPFDTTSGRVRSLSRASGHLRILLHQPGAVNEVVGVIHVRDVLLDPDEAPVADRARAPFHMSVSTPISSGLEEMRRARQHLAVITDPQGRYRGVVTLTDILRKLFPAAA